MGRRAIENFLQEFLIILFSFRDRFPNG